MGLPRDPQSKIMTREACAALMARERVGMRWVFTNGCFDILHAGHATCLAAARALGDRLVVGLNSDASVRRLKGPARPVVDEADRALLVASLECVDCVVIFDEATPVELLQCLRPDIHVKGGDYAAETLPEYPVVRSWGGEVRILPHTGGRSTTGLIDRILRTEKNGEKK